MPLLILGTASAALKAIQQGCELYKEFKDVVAEAKTTFDEVKGNVDEVVGVWAFIKSKLFPDTEKPPPKLVAQDPVRDAVQQTVQKKPNVQPEQHSEIEVTKGLLDNLKVFFECQAQLQIKVQEAEEASLNVDNNIMGSALDIEFALSEVEKMQKKIREIMVYQSPPELGDLYTRVVNRMGVIREQQYLARREALIKARRERWQREHQAHQVVDNVVVTVVAVLLIAQTWGLLLAIRR